MATHSADLGAGVGAERPPVTRERRRTFTETKLGYKTTEFVFALAMIVALIVAVYVGDADLDAADGWRYASWVAAAYIISRGFAKLGTREPYTED